MPVDESTPKERKREKLAREWQIIAAATQVLQSGNPLDDMEPDDQTWVRLRITAFRQIDEIKHLRPEPRRRR